MLVPRIELLLTVAHLDMMRAKSRALTATMQWQGASRWVLAVSGILTDGELVQAAQAGDVTSLGALLERHRADMQATAFSILGYSPEAQDAVQDAMLTTLQRLGQLRDPEAIGSWLRAIVRNACRMRLRRPRAELVDDLANLAIQSDPTSPEELIERHALRDWVWQSVQELSEPLQLVVLLRYFSSVTSYDQIAALCGLPIGTVRSRLSQARQKLGVALLATAGSAYDDSATLVAHRQVEVSGLFAAAERGHFAAALAESWSADLTLVGPKGQVSRGRDTLVRIMESDLDAGVRQRPIDVAASRHFTIIETDLLSPPWDPDHCPSGAVWVLFLHDDIVEKVRLFHPRTGIPD